MVEGSPVLSRLQELIAQESEYTDEFEVEKGMIKRFALAIGDTNPLYHDEEFAKVTAYGGMVAPPTFFFEWNHHRHWLPGLSSKQRQSIFADLQREPRLLRAGNEFEIIRPVRPGDIIKSKSRLTNVYEKEGKSGQLIFVVCQTDYFNQRGEALATNKDVLVILL